MKYLIEHALEHRHLWRNEGNHYWLARLQEEVAELVLALDGQHDDPPSHELGQIATICINWLNKDGYFTYPEDGQENEHYSLVDSFAELSRLIGKSVEDIEDVVAWVREIRGSEQEEG